MATRTFIASSQETVTEFENFLEFLQSALNNEIELNGDIYEENRGPWNELVEFLENVEKRITNVKESIYNGQEVTA